jgi:hypothetical protein
MLKETTIEVGDKLPCPWCDRNNGQVIAKIKKITNMSKKIINVKYIYLDCNDTHIITIWKKRDE